MKSFYNGFLTFQILSMSSGCLPAAGTSRKFVLLQYNVDYEEFFGGKGNRLKNGRVCAMAVRGRRPPDAAEVSRVVCKKSTENLVLVKKSFFVLFAIFKAFLKFNEIFAKI